MLSNTTLRELRLELDDLRSRATAIELVIGAACEAAPLHGWGKPMDSDSLSGRIREALTEIEGPTRSIEVVEWLERNSVLCNGRIPNVKQVATALWRMSKRSLSRVECVARGYYRIAVLEQAEQAVDTEPQDG